MVSKKYTGEQIIAVLREADAGAKVTDLCRKYGMSDATYYNWKGAAGLRVVMATTNEDTSTIKARIASLSLNGRA